MNKRKMGYSVDSITLVGIRVPIDRIKNKIIISDYCKNNHKCNCESYYGHYILLDEGKHRYDIYQEIINNEPCYSHVFIYIYKVCVGKYDKTFYAKINKSLIELYDDSNIFKQILLEYDIVNEEEFDEDFGIYNVLEYSY